MKRYFIIILLVSLNFCIYSQKYYQIPDTLSSWDVAYSTYPEDNLTNLVRYESYGDTIVNQKSYIKIYTTIKTSYYGVFYNPKVPAPHVDSTKSFYGLIRNTNEGKAFVILDSIEYILYDFSLKINDSINVSRYKNYDFYLKVINIDTLIINGTSRKRLELSQLPLGGFNLPTYWIEGIGSVNGLFSNQCCTEYGSGSLLCFKVQDTILFSPTGECYNFSTNINTNHLTQDIKIYPIPVIDKSVVIIPQNPNYNFINIYDIYLRKTSQAVILNKNEYIIDHNQYTPGIYFVEIIDSKGNRLTKKIIVE